MSRYVHVATPALCDLDEITAGLVQLGLPVERGRRRRMLEGSVECSGEPVDLRLPAGTADSVEDFGFIQGPDGPVLVCGELDRELLEQALLAPLRQAITELRLRQAAGDAGLKVEQATDADGQRRLILRRG